MPSPSFGDAPGHTSQSGGGGGGASDADGVIDAVLRELRHENEQRGLLDGVDPLF